jgi:twitching motility protein PilJ
MAISKDSTRLLPWLGWALAALLLVSGALLYFVAPAGGADASGVVRIGRVVATAQSARAEAAALLAGGGGNAESLADAGAAIAEQWRAATAGGSRAALGALAAAGGDVNEVVGGIDGLTAVLPTLERVDAAADDVQRLLPQLLASTSSLFAQTRAAATSANQPFVSWLEQAVAGLQDAISSRSATRPAADFLQQLRTGQASVAAIVGGITGVDDSLGMRSARGNADPVDVDTTLRLLDELQTGIGAIVGAEAQLVAGAEAFARLDRGAQALAQRYGSVDVPAAGASGGSLVTLVVLGLLGAGLLILAVMMFAFARARQLSRSADIHAEQNERNQQAILRLLDELSNLADGDLTVRATVTEDITGAIADSINYAIEALRELVITIKDTSLLVDAAAKQSEATAHHMVRASETQAKQAIAASNSIAQMTASVEEVSGNAERCSDVARHSVEVAHKGGEAVRRTIEGMNMIRETIQDTSKRIKRLGESSQEIGNIVELIEEIADQTNILALNASIEASRAGEASRGFAVVADEVQKLAERSTAATRKIEVLVSTIQSDTNEAVVSMERSTTDVVGGALLAENAGAALEEIEQVSHQIASLVQNISGSAREQTVSANAIARNMEVLKDVSAKTKQSTTATSSAISKLSELASQLRRTVSGFTLPEQKKAAPSAARPAAAQAHNASVGQQSDLDVFGDVDDLVERRQEAVGDLR